MSVYPISGSHVTLVSHEVCAEFRISATLTQFGSKRVRRESCT